jgi:hypothetical protein
LDEGLVGGTRIVDRPMATHKFAALSLLDDKEGYGSGSEVINSL